MFLGRLNWWADVGVCQRLLPLATVGDGNCLLHAASLGMWGFQDRLLTLRKALYGTLTSHLAKGAIKRRWRLQQWEKNINAGGLLYSEDEWEKEWQEVLRIASTQRRLDHEQKAAETKKGGDTVATLATIAEKDSDNTSDGPGKEDTTSKADQSETEKQKEVKDNLDCQSDSSTQEGLKETETEGGTFESLEDIHVFVLAHVLRRAIIVIADQYLYGFGGEPIAPIPFGGVYLPLECDPSNCFKSPLVLAFDSAHFSPLVLCDENKDTKSNWLKASVPLVGPNHELLPIQFSVDPGEDFLWSSLDDDSSIVEKLALSMDKKLQLLKKYLDVDLIKIPSASKKDSSEDGKSTAKGEKSSEAGSSDGGVKPEKKLSSKSVEKKEKSWIATQILKVGTMAGVVGGVVHSDIYVAKLQTDKKPEYYDKMIENYIQSAKLRFEEEKKSKVKTDKGTGNNGEKPQPCINPGCQLYGTSATNYLCSGCFKTQKSYSETGRYLDGSSSTGGSSSVSNYDNYSGLPSYWPHPAYSAYVPYGYFGDRTGSRQSHSTSAVDQKTLQPSREGQGSPPSYDEAMNLSSKSTFSSLPSGSTVKLDSIDDSTGKGSGGQSVINCSNKDCKFYGSPENKEYCSLCFKTYQKSLRYMIEENEASKSKVT